MAKYPSWEKNGDRYAVYERTTEYDPKTKNTRLVNKKYLGTVDRHGEEPQRKALSVVAVYEHGFIEYMLSMLAELPIWIAYTSILNEKQRNLLGLLVGFLIETRDSITLFPLWLKNQWQGRDGASAMSDVSLLRDYLEEFGRIIEKADKKKLFSLSPKNSYHHETSATLPVAVKAELTLVGSPRLEKHQRNITLSVFGKLDSDVCTVLPFRAPDYASFSFKDNIHLTKIMKAPDRENMENSGDTDEVKNAGHQIALIHSEVSSMVHRTLSFLSETEDEMLYPVAIGLYGAMSVVIQLKIRLAKVTSSNLKGIENVLRSIYYEKSRSKMIVDANGGEVPLSVE